MMSLGLLRRQQNSGLGIVFLIGLTVLFAYGIFTCKLGWLQAVMSIFTLYALILLVLPFLVKKKTSLRSDVYRPFVSILIPAKNEEPVIGQTILSLSKLHYFRNSRPNFEIIVIDDASTDGTALILQKLERQFDFLTIVSKSGGASGKAAALNSGFAHARGDVIAVFDADSQVDSDFLSKSVSFLYDESVGGVQGRVKLYNPDENVVTRLQQDEFHVFNHLTQLGKDAAGGITCLGGNGQLVKRDALTAVGGWNEESLTEDFDLTFRLLFHRYKIRYAPEAVLRQEAVHSWKLLFRQRTRWGEGLLSSLFDFFLPVFSARMSWIERIDGLLTLSRILVPFFIIEGYLYQILGHAFQFPFQQSITPLLLLALTVLFFVSMGYGLSKIEPCSFGRMTFRIVQYWLYSAVWILVLPVSYVNYFKTSRAEFWDKTHHKGFDEEFAVGSTLAALD